MFVFDMTAQMAPIFHGMVALLALCGAAITANAFGTNLTKVFLTVVRRNKTVMRDNKPRVSRRPSIVPASA